MKIVTTNVSENRHSRESGNPGSNLLIKWKLKDLDARFRGDDEALKKRKPFRKIDYFPPIPGQKNQKPIFRMQKKNTHSSFLGFMTILTIGLVLFLVLNGLAHANGSFGQSSDLFTMGAGARSMAMGGAFTGLADDGSAPYYNPAGLAYLDEHQLTVMHAPLYLNSSYNYLSTVHPFGDKYGALALSDTTLLSKGIEARDFSNRLINSGESLQNSGILLSYSRKIRQRLSLGLNTKLIQQKLIGYSDNTLGLDLGLMFHPFPFLSLGASRANINSPEIKLNKESDVYHPLTRFGFAADVFKNKITLTADTIKINQQKRTYAMGIEYIPTRMLNFRGGYNDNRSYTFGLGVKFKAFRLDYALSTTDLGALNKVSFTWAWHNIYKSSLEPPFKEGRAVYPLQGLQNEIAFKPTVPNQTVANWSLVIRDRKGKEVKTLQGNLRPPVLINWDARNNIGEPTIEGTYTYDFLVNYKNGKSWQVKGNLDLDLPKTINEVIDMNLQLNGAGVIELTQQEQAKIQKEETGNNPEEVNVQDLKNEQVNEVPRTEETNTQDETKDDVLP